MSANQAEVAAPTGFHILMPPGWQRYLADDDGKRALLAKTSSRMKALGRPDLDAEARTLVEVQWRRLRSSRVTAVYLPGETDDVLPPASIAVRQHVAPEGDFAGSARRLADGPVEQFETRTGTVLRWQTDAGPSAEAGGIRSRRIGYAFALPAAEARRGLIFVAVIPYPDDADPAMVQALTELMDTVMETFRWR